MVEQSPVQHEPRGARQFKRTGSKAAKQDLRIHRRFTRLATKPLDSFLGLLHKIVQWFCGV
jgi:hypothetical protein